MARPPEIAETQLISNDQEHQEFLGTILALSWHPGRACARAKLFHPNGRVKLLSPSGDFVSMLWAQKAELALTPICLVSMNTLPMSRFT